MPKKLPIPRLENVRHESRRTRTGRACETCRERRTKCNGDRPMCAQCAAQGLVNCVYTENKTARGRTQLHSAEQKNVLYEELLRELSNGANTPLAERITRILEDPSATGNDKKSSSALSSSVFRPLNDTDTVGEDLNRSENSRATGYMGKNSDVAWMRQLDAGLSRQEKHTVSSEETRQYLLPIEPSTASMSYHLNHGHSYSTEGLDAFALPAKPLADHLFHVFLNEAHIVLPIIRKDLFIGQYQRLYTNPSKRPGKKWLAVFNLVLAIGSRFSRASRQYEQDIGDEQMFLSRAKILNYSEIYGDLQQVQAETLMAFYFLSSSQINRSWKTVGIATRSAIALGLNLESSSTKLDPIAKEARKRLWWSIFYLEHILTIMTGRVSCLGDGSYSVPPIWPFESMECAVSDAHQQRHARLAQDGVFQWTIHQHHEQIEAQQRRLKHVAPSPSLCLFYMLDLSLIIHAITSRMYSTDMFQEGSSRPLHQIDLYNKMMDRWVSGLHSSMAFEDDQGNPFPWNMSRYQVSLALHYYSSRIVLNRPCLMGPTMDKKYGRFLQRPQYGNDITSACRASLSLLSVLPDRPDARWAYDVSPWWTVLTILGYCLEKNKTTKPEERDATASESIEVIIATIKKALFWLCCLGKSDEAARRAFQLCNSFYHRIAAEKGLNLDGMPSTEVFCFPSDWHQGRGFEEASSPASRCRNQDSEGLYFPVLTWTPGLGHDIGDDGTLSRDPREPLIPLDILQNPCAWLDIDVNMPDFISQRPIQFQDRIGSTD